MGKEVEDDQEAPKISSLVDHVKHEECIGRAISISLEREGTEGEAIEVGEDIRPNTRSVGRNQHS